jgi:predicted membrane protein
MTNIAAPSAVNPADYVNTTVVFGETKRTVISKDFKGGRIASLFGATKLDFTNADIQGVVVLDISQVMSETKIRVPSDWRVEADQTLFLATIDDKRTVLSQNINAGKVLILTGISIFGVVTIKDSL